MNKTEKILNGNIPKTLMEFAIPIILGNVFQLLYNIVDAIVVGKFLGDLPLAGISVASPAMDILNAILIGSTVGIGVLVGHTVGANKLDDLKSLHSTAIIGGGIITVVLALIGTISMKKILLWQGTEEIVCDEAMKYLIVILSGLIFCFYYNYFAAILRAYGDSRTPFIVLLCASTIHALLDVVLVGIAKMEIYGVAISTVFCQALSAIVLIVYTYKKCPPFALSKKEMIFEKAHASKLLSYAWASSLQQAVVCIGRFLVQGSLTSLGTTIVTGYNMGFKVELFVQCFSQGISASMIVAISQNMGNRNTKRAADFFYTTLKAMTISYVIFALILFTFPGEIASIFSTNSSVIASAKMYIRTMAFIYIFSFYGEAFQGFFRGIGKLKVTMIASLLQIVWRVAMSFLLVEKYRMYGICFSVASGWILLVIIEGLFTLKNARKLANNTLIL